MVKRILAVAALLALAPFAATAATVNTGPSGATISYDGAAVSNDIDLGDFNLSLGPISVSADFIKLLSTQPIDGSITFGVYSDPLAPGAEGSVDVNIITSNGGTFEGTFGGAPLNFTPVGGDDVAEFSGSFGSTSDVIDFVLKFENFAGGDVIQLNVQAIPVPAALPLLLAGLGGFGLLRRRQKTA